MEIPRSATVVRLLAVLLAVSVLAGCAGTGTIPTRPSDVVATAGPGSIGVSWSDNSEDETAFVVQRAADGAFADLATVPADTGTYLDGAVTSAAPYVYRVVAVGTGGRSAPSEPSLPVRPLTAGVPVVDPDDPVGVSLNTLGIDTSATPRLGDRGAPLPDDYAPLGTRVALGAGARAAASYELLIGGPATSRDGFSSNQVVWQADADGAPNVVNPMYGLNADVFDVASAPSGLYQATAGDLDGDGLDEYVMVVLRGADGADLTVLVLDVDHAGPTPVYQTSETFVASRPGATDVEVVAADFDGDGIDTLVIGLGFAGGAELLVLGTQAAAFVVDRSLAIPASVAGADTSVRLAAGNLDDDAGAELAVAVNEVVGSGGVARYVVFDDAHAAFATLAQGAVRGEDGALHTALVADVAVGDLDGDRRDEVVFAGLTAFHDTCVPYGLLYVVLDDALPGTDLRLLGAKLRTVSMGAACTAAKVKRLRFVHVELGDVDGDGRAEIVGGPMVFDDWSSPWAELGYIPADQMYGHGSEDAAATINKRNSALALVDMDGDGASEVVAYMARAEAVIRYRLPPSGGPLVGMTWWVVDGAVTSNGSRFRPMLVPANVDLDSLVARAVPATYAFTVTEPIIVAALAAAPCHDAISQNLGACGTSWGEGSSQGSESQVTVTASGSVSFGLKASGGLTQTELEVKGTLSLAVSEVQSRSYELTKQVVYATGPLEDAVVFSAVPYDQYTYEIVQHPDPTLIGEPVIVRLPREPVTVLVERSVFNGAQRTGAFLVDERVFGHAVGAPDTYRSVAEREALAAALHAGHGREMLRNGPVSVGQGTGSTAVTIDVSEATSVGSALEVGFSFDLQAVGATVLGGFSVGRSTEASFAWSTGTSTTYAAGVGNIADPIEFARDGYRYGMFVYVFEDDATGQQFEVIDFWVE